MDKHNNEARCDQWAGVMSNHLDLNVNCIKDIFLIMFIIGPHVRHKLVMNMMMYMENQISVLIFKVMTDPVVLHQDVEDQKVVPVQ